MNKPVHPSRKEISRDRILDVASRVIREKGFHGVGIADVMKEAGLTHGGFYAHFSSRDELLCAAVERANVESGAALKDHMARLTHAGLSPFRALVEAYLYEAVITCRDTSCPVTALSSEGPTQSDEVMHALREVVVRLHRLVRQTLPEDQSADAAWAITSALVGAVQLARMLGDNPEGRAALAGAKHELLNRYPF